MVTDLLGVLFLSMPEDIRDQVEENIFEEFRSEDHLGPVMTLFQHVENITYNVASKLLDTFAS